MIAFFDQSSLPFSTGTPVAWDGTRWINVLEARSAPTGSPLNDSYLRYLDLIRKGPVYVPAGIAPVG